MESHSEDNLNQMMNDYMEYAETNLSSSGGEEQGKESRRKGEEENVEEKGKNVVPPEKKQRVGRKTSSVWDHYTMLPDCDPKKPRAACNYCGANYAADTKMNGTSTLWAHVERKCKKCPFSDWVEQGKRKQSTMDRFAKISTPNSEGGVLLKFNPNDVRKAIAEYITVDELSFRHVEGKGFQKFVHFFNPTYQFPSRFTIARDIYNAFVDQKKDLKSILMKYRVSLTTDCWTSIQNISYLCLTAHWVDDNWKLQKRIINFIQVPSHKGDMVGKELINCLNEWGISSVFAVTVDNASSNDVALRKLKGDLLEKHNVLPLNGEIFHMRCSAHILNLIVTDGLKEINDSISSIRNAVRYVRSSPARLKRFKESCKDSNIESKALLCLDVVTRWNFTYLMLGAAIKFKKAFDNLEGDANYTKYFDEEKMDGPPTNLDWEKAVIFVEFLKSFYILTNRFSGSLYVTSNLFLPDIFKIQNRLIKMADNPDTLLGAMAVSMKRKYDKYWGRTEKLNMLTFIANIVDPRYKLEIVNRGFKILYTSSEAEKMIKLVKTNLSQLYAFYKQQQQSSSQLQSSSQSQPSQPSQPSQAELDEEDEFQLADDIEEDDLEYYLNDRREKQDAAFDILQWWKSNGFKYLIVARMAKDALAVQMSTVASESAFSTGGRILDSFRSSLSPKMVEALIYSKNWYTCHSEEPIVVRQYMDEIEGLEACEQVLPGDDGNVSKYPGCGSESAVDK